jgi:hypothetical protein
VAQATGLCRAATRRPEREVARYFFERLFALPTSGEWPDVSSRTLDAVFAAAFFAMRQIVRAQFGGGDSVFVGPGGSWTPPSTAFIIPNGRLKYNQPSRFVRPP